MLGLGHCHTEELGLSNLLAAMWREGEAAVQPRPLAKVTLGLLVASSCLRLAMAQACGQPIHMACRGTVDRDLAHSARASPTERETSG